MDEMIKAKIMMNYTNSSEYEINNFIYELQQENMISTHEAMILMDWTKDYMKSRSS